MMSSSQSIESRVVAGLLQDSSFERGKKIPWALKVVLVSLSLVAFFLPTFSFTFYLSGRRRRSKSSSSSRSSSRSRRLKGESSREG